MHQNTEQKRLIQKRESQYREMERINTRGFFIGAFTGALSALTTGFILKKYWRPFAKLSPSLKNITFASCIMAGAIIKSEKDVENYLGKLFEESATANESFPTIPPSNAIPFVWRWKYPIVGSFATAIAVSSWRKFQMKGLTKQQVFYNTRLATQGAAFALLFSLIAYNRLCERNKKS